MKHFSWIFFAGILFAALAPLSAAWAQATADASPNSSSPATALSNGATASTSALPSAIATTKRKSTYSARAGAAREKTMTVLSKNNGTLQELCFQPGVGWLHAPQSLRGATGASQAVTTALGNRSKSVLCPAEMTGGGVSSLNITAMTRDETPSPSRTAPSVTSEWTTKLGAQDWLQST